MIKDSHSPFLMDWAVTASPPPQEMARAEQTKLLELPVPQTQGGKFLMQALHDRCSSREFSRSGLPTQVLSNLLWAAFGVNRPESGGRTAPSAQHWQEIDVYVCLEEGLFVYDASGHVLRLLLQRDIRALTGLQPFVVDAPVNLVYVADYSRTRDAGEEERHLYCGADTGFISQNVYLFCASEGLATVVHGAINRPALAQAMKLAAHQRVILAQTVGYPARLH